MLTLYASDIGLSAFQKGFEPCRCVHGVCVSGRLSDPKADSGQYLINVVSSLSLGGSEGNGSSSINSKGCVLACVSSALCLNNTHTRAQNRA